MSHESTTVTVLVSTLDREETAIANVEARKGRGRARVPWVSDRVSRQCGAFERPRFLSCHGAADRRSYMDSTLPASRRARHSGRLVEFFPPSSRRRATQDVLRTR